jgi:hypothetical protein
MSEYHGEKKFESVMNSYICSIKDKVEEFNVESQRMNEVHERFLESLWKERRFFICLFCENKKLSTDLSD